MSLVSQAYRDAGEAIGRQVDEIARSWRDLVRGDAAIAGDDRLPDLLLTNQVPALLADIAQALKEGEDGASPDRSIARRRRGLRFGKLRGLAHYDAADLYREFRHLRHAIWRFLRRELDWGRGDAFEVMLAIDQYLDEVIGASLRGYVEASEHAAGRAPADPPRD
ncbi:MAG TPA: RsbRD N-terminal domain-containing protein [Candidatus Methylomirabilis sp.]|nr:RsbRD N-terminal domain-containing protein [Candidatus Methylomirabilis sp.]